jgi:type I restriction enzyme M protein
LAKKKNGKVKEDKSFEEKLWDSAEKLRGPLESAQYKYVVLGLLFLKYSFPNFFQHLLK